MLSPDFQKITRLQKWLSVFTNILYYIPKRILKLQYTHIVMIMTCVTCRLMYALCIYARWPIVVHISAPNTTEETREDSPSVARSTDISVFYGYLRFFWTTEGYRLVLQFLRIFPATHAICFLMLK